MHVLGIDWVGLNGENGRRLLLSLCFVGFVVGAGQGARAALGRLIGSTSERMMRLKFWGRQCVSILVALVLVCGLASIWFSDPARLASALGLFSAGLAFALQQVITAVAGYIVILRGGNFAVGDRIAMGGVRGDVIRLGFIQTTIMEMGQPDDAPGNGGAQAGGTWVHSRQFTGRIVTVSNAKIFSEPVFNYSRDFPFIWEELTIPLPFDADAERVEAILLAAAHRHALDAQAAVHQSKGELEHRFGVDPVDLAPSVFFHLTSNWLELTVRFVAGTHQIRRLKDRMTRDILKDLGASGIAVAAARLDVGGNPPASRPR